MSERGQVTEQHRRRRAVVYVRQSTLQQVERNVESSARQYALRERAVELGWPMSSVVVVDEDMGRSGATSESRIGFKELVVDGQQLPRRTVGQRRIRWARASYGAVHDFLTNPAYAGAFVFGRTRRAKTIGPDGRARVRDLELPLEQWS